jgi:Rod binding domain-containing protein
MADPVLQALEQATAPLAAAKVRPVDKVREAAEAFESVFLNQLLDTMFSGIDTDQTFGGGSSEKIYRSMMNKEIGDSIARAGGIGLSETIQREILAMQEVA